MSVLRAEIKQRLGDHSIYDGVVEYASDFETDDFLQAVHYGSLFICLNLDAENVGDEPAASDLYTKKEDGTWAYVTSVNKGKNGESAYEVAVDNGFVGTESEWLESLVGDAGPAGPGVAPGGTTGQILKKKSNTDYDTEWVNDSGSTDSAAVHYTADSNKTDAEKTQARANIDASGDYFVVEFTKPSTNWTASKTLQEVGAARTAGKTIMFKYKTEMAFADYVSDVSGSYYRANLVIKEDTVINEYMISYVNGVGVTVTVTELATGSSSSTDSDAVHYTADSNRTSAEKAQARTNIGAPAADTGDVSSPCIKALLSDSEGVQIVGGYDIYDVANIELAGSVNDEAVRVRGVADPTIGVDAANKRYVDGAKVTDSSSTSITLDSAADNTVYEYGTLTALTVTAIANPGSFIIRFTSGSTATTTNFPAGMKFPEAFAAEANTRYEINVVDGYALAVGWPTT